LLRIAEIEGQKLNPSKAGEADAEQHEKTLHSYRNNQAHEF
jgi:hypothetical protein